MKKILILHGFESNSKEHWFLRAKEKFQKDGFEVHIPDMPGAFFPKKDEWIKVINSFHPDENWILIGHSLGGVAILKYLENAPKKISQTILIATPYEPMKFGAIENFFEGGFNWEKIKNNCPKFTIVNEDNDPFVPLEHGKQYADKLDGDLKIQKGFVHFDKIDLDFLEKIIKD